MNKRQQKRFEGLIVGVFAVIMIIAGFVLIGFGKLTIGASLIVAALVTALFMKEEYD